MLCKSCNVVDNVIGYLALIIFSTFIVASGHTHVGDWVLTEYFVLVATAHDNCRMGGIVLQKVGEQYHFLQVGRGQV